MTTLALLKAEIADDIDRTDLTSAIASEITKAIRHYQTTRFYFNESRDETFATVASQKLYSSSDDAAMPKFIDIDQIYVVDGTQAFELDRIAPKEWEMCTADGQPVARPCEYTVYNRSIGLYPIPDAAYTVRVIGLIQVEAPASDSEAGNLWMTEAFDLIRARVCRQLALKKTRDTESYQAQSAAEAEELNRLLAETASRLGTGYVTPTEF
jgi:hypothetical protein